MSKFTDSEDWCLPNYTNKSFKTIKPLPWEIGCKGSALWITVPAGFVFDISVPKYLHWAVNPMDTRLRKAAALHDYAFFSGWDRVSAASVFSEALRATKVGKLHRLLLVCSVIVWNWE